MAWRSMAAWGVCGWATAALAVPVEVVLTERATAGNGTPSMQVHIRERIAAFELKLHRSDGRDLSFTGDGAPGTVCEFPLSQPIGSFRYTGELTVSFPNSQTSAMPLQFDTELIGPLDLSIERSDLDLVHRKLRFKLSRPAQKARLAILMDSGQWAMDEEISFRGEPAGTRLEVAWPEAAGQVLKIAIRAYDTSDTYTGVELFPWQLEFFSPDLSRELGKRELRSDQHAKLDRTFRAVNEAAARLAPLVPVRLFIVVRAGSGEEADQLVLLRARAVARYFRRRGMRIPILYEALRQSGVRPRAAGEEGAPTPAFQYILSVVDPALEDGQAEPSWRKL
ncbi:MAG TPA: OmpA family protein [Myxococcaceae bacterium]|nr:OmpA family protein [Myxococcaceae bacterium]